MPDLHVVVAAHVRHLRAEAAGHRASGHLWEAADLDRQADMLAEQHARQNDAEESGA